MKIRKIPFALAVMCLVSMIAACSDKDDAISTMTELVPNVITQSEAETVTTPPITDAEGNTYASVETKSPEQLQSEIDAMMTAPVQTTVTNVVTQPANSIKSADKYAYNTLTDFEKALYDAIVQNVSALKINVPNAYGNVEYETWNKIYGMVYNQEPQLFWMSPRITSSINVGKLYYRTRDPEAIKSMQAEIDKTVNKLVSEMSGMTTYEKLNYINTYLAMNSTFVKVDSLGDQAIYNETIYNAFAGGTEKQGDIQCSGYAHAVQYLCDILGIESMFVTGTNETGYSHAWNVVKVDGNWYNFDATWSDPILETPNYKNITHMYTFVPDNWIINKTHFSHNKLILQDGTEILYFTPPVCNSDTMNWFKQEGKLYSDAASAKAEIKSQLDNAAKNGLRTAEIMCSSKTVYDAVKADAMSMQNELKGKYSNVKGLSDKSNVNMLVIELDVIYN